MWVIGKYFVNKEFNFVMIPVWMYTKYLSLKIFLKMFDFAMILVRMYAKCLKNVFEKSVRCEKHLFLSF